VPSNFRTLGLKHLLESLRIEANHHLVANNDGRSGTALVLGYQFPYSRKITGYVSHLKLNSSLREEGLGNMAWRSTGLAEDDDLVLLH
jgi:hypothetical protein